MIVKDATWWQDRPQNSVDASKLMVIDAKSWQKGKGEIEEKRASEGPSSTDTIAVQKSPRGASPCNDPDLSCAI